MINDKTILRSYYLTCLTVFIKKSAPNGTLQILFVCVETLRATPLPCQPLRQNVSIIKNTVRLYGYFLYGALGSMSPHQLRIF